MNTLLGLMLFPSLCLYFMPKQYFVKKKIQERLSDAIENQGKILFQIWD